MRSLIVLSLFALCAISYGFTLNLREFDDERLLLGEHLRVRKSAESKSSESKSKEEVHAGSGQEGSGVEAEEHKRVARHVDMSRFRRDEDAVVGGSGQEASGQEPAAAIVTRRRRDTDVVEASGQEGSGQN